ncbi:hypothetical protein PT2222_210180 [Paraburkholderia tropica]
MDRILPTRTRLDRRNREDWPSGQESVTNPAAKSEGKRGRTAQNRAKITRAIDDKYATETRVRAVRTLSANQ